MALTAEQEATLVALADALTADQASDGGALVAALSDAGVTASAAPGIAANLAMAAQLTALDGMSELARIQGLALNSAAAAAQDAITTARATAKAARDGIGLTAGSTPADARATAAQAVGDSQVAMATLKAAVDAAAAALAAFGA